MRVFRGVRPGRDISRRTWLEWAASGIAAVWIAPRATAAPPIELIVRNRRPLDLETPVAALDARLTPNDAFFVRSHFGHPAVNPDEPWTVELGGHVERPGTFKLADLEALGTTTITAVLQCAGNGRAFHSPRIPGLLWERGAVGNAEWTGVPLAALLDRAGLMSGVAHVHFLGADAPPSPKTPAWLRSIPLDKAMARGTILATRMNGEPIPVIHGGPLRLIVPGWTGNHWFKWVRSISVATDEAPGFYMQTGYRIARTPAPPDALLKPSDVVPVTSMNVKSLITGPAEGATVPRGRVEVRGVAWTGEGEVTNVDVSLNGGEWQSATLIDRDQQWGWRRWTLAVDGNPGRLAVRARATDSTGAVQPETSPWNKSGYLWNGFDQVTCEVV